MTKDDAARLDFVFEAAPTGVGKAGIVIADDPDPLEASGQSRQQRARVRRQAFAAEAVVEAVAEAIELHSAGLLDLRSEGAQRGMRIVRWEELAEARKPARFFKVEVRNQQRSPTRPEKRTGMRRQ